MLLVNLGLFVLSAIFLVISGSWLVKSLSRIAVFLRISEFTAAFIIMAVGTSIPELFVGISSSLSGNGAISLGNVIGANVANIALIGGIVLLLGRKIHLNLTHLKSDSFHMLAFAFLPLLLMFIGRSLSRIDGVILLLVFGYNVYRLLKTSERFSKPVEGTIKRIEVLYNFSLFMSSILLLFISSRFVVKYATLISLDLMLPPIVIGLFFVSIGTSLPELVFSTRSVLGGHQSMHFGDMIGSVITNSTLVLGVASIIRPINASFILFASSGLFMLLTILTFIFLIYVKEELTWKHGLFFLLLYGIFLLTEVGIGFS